MKEHHATSGADLLSHKAIRIASEKSACIRFFLMAGSFGANNGALKGNAMGKSIRKFREHDDSDTRDDSWKRNRNAERKHKEAQRASVFSRDEDDFSLDMLRDIVQRR